MNREEKLEKCLDEIDLIIYRMRFVGFNSNKDYIIFCNKILNDIRKICQLKDLEKFKEVNND